MTRSPTSALDRAFESWTLGPLRLRNRFIKAATNEGMARGGVPSRALLEHHRALSAGGVGMTTLAYCAVSADGRTFEDQVRLDEDALPALRAITDAVHGEGGAACAQITHGGAFNFLRRLSVPRPLSASGGFNAAGVISGRLFKAQMQPADLQSVAAEFVAAARLAERAGFDAVELHMGHGYLLSQFLSPKYNRRRDGWGGDAAARARYPAEVLSRVLDAVGARLAVLCKLSTVEGFRGGAGIEDSTIVARELSAAGAHLLVLSAGMNVESPWTIFGSKVAAAAGEHAPSLAMRAANPLLRLQEPNLQFRELYLLETSRRIRAAVASPLAYLGGVTSAAGVATVMAEGFDAVAMARALIHQPQFVQALRAGVEHSGCTACNRCVGMMYTPGGTRCVLTGIDRPELNRQPAQEP
ncbi:2,4-dienoyl-CoA reductase-like NADH-dependent reductase (Old Yellow Enzyme family) [Panacagrimonas perspica]|uniref:2,4-dienoyl-CoA reductase-like NADH-dependent reductase (Old Yellow Enzyme family) n=1 Tax=Panacagrimonas perspica TaxID=381431 RepID=A0A4S3K0G8_9GAMM|nr:NADH:flavin oxidoreductase [Panacagrimonas perspica]TDU23220.1 2,4-dienoyl-CoA reductase-like NADH-dependent reductase (Old Yellow Enzyme family) [Panacagrimonas perspica]THD01376.1 flavin oxidoreductase [Panacagrimonas perspica]